MEDTEIITNVGLNLHKLKVGESYNVTKNSKDQKPIFNMVGTGEGAAQRQSIDLLQEVANMSSNEKLCFFFIKEHIVYSAYNKRFIYQAKVRMDNLTRSQRSNFSRGYKLLKEKDLVKRISKGVYMINPRALIPSNFKEELKIWESK